MDSYCVNIVDLLLNKAQISHRLLFCVCLLDPLPTTPGIIKDIY